MTTDPPTKAREAEYAEEAGHAGTADSAADADTLGGKTESSLSVDHATSADSAADADTLGGQSPGYYETPSSTSTTDDVFGYVNYISGYRGGSKSLEDPTASDGYRIEILPDGETIDVNWTIELTDGTSYSDSVSSVSSNTTIERNISQGYVQYIEVDSNASSGGTDCRGDLHHLGLPAHSHPL